MRFLILVSILFWGTIIANYAQNLSPNVEGNEEVLIDDGHSEENTLSISAIDHQQFDSSYSNPSQTEVSTSSSSTPLIDRYKNPEAGLGIGIRHLGILTKVGMEKSVYRQMSVGLYYGRFLGHYYGTHKKGVIPGLDHYSLEFNIYLNSHKKVFTSGPILKFGAHYNYLKNSPNTQQVEVKGEKVIGRGEHKWGPLIGAAYSWQGPYVNLSVGLEYFVLGKLKSFVPLSVGLGIAF